MKKNLILSFLILSVLVMMIGSVSAYDSSLTLENKNPSTWQPITGDGIQAILQYNSIGQKFEYKLEAEGLDDVEYALIYYADDEDRFNVWGGSPAFLIDSGTASSGELVLEGGVDIGDLPFATDWNVNGEPNYCDFNNGYDDYEHCYGAKIWLVRSVDYNEVEQTVYPNWNPTEWLFETDLITYTEDDEGPTFGETTIEPEYPNCENTLITINSEITDESGVTFAELFWKYDGGNEFHKAPQFKDGLWVTKIYIGELEDETEITYYIKATDNVGNEGWSSSNYEHLFTYDCSPPETTITISEPKYENEEIYVSGGAEITLECTDTISGCDETYFMVKYGEEIVQDWTIYTDPLPVPEDAPDGLYTIYYYSVDNAGNTEDEKTQEIILDNTSPEVVLTELEEFYNSVPVNLEFTYSDSGSGVGEYKVYKKRLGVDSDFVDVTSSMSCDIIEDTTTCEFMDGSEDGKFEFKVEVIDNVENSQNSNIVSTTLDRAGPDAVNLDFPEDDSYLNEQPLLSWFEGEDNDNNLNPPYGEYGVSGIKEYELELDDGEPITLSELSYQTSELEEGEHSWRVRAWDNAGNEGTWSETRTFVIDTIAPEISDVNVEPYYEGSIYVAGTVTASATVTDDNGVDSVTFSLGNVECDAEQVDDTWSCDIDTTSLADGEYTLIVTAVDVSENEEVDDSLVVIVDNTAPTTEIISPKKSSLFASDFDVSVKDSDDDSGLDYCEYRVYNDINGDGDMTDVGELIRDWTIRTCDNQVTLTVGEGMDCRIEGIDRCKVQVRAVDNLGNDNWQAPYITKSRTFSIDWTNPPHILSSGPSGTVVNSVTTLYVETNKPATCRYDTVYKSSYDAMNYEMNTTGGTLSSQTITGLKDQAYNYYVLCKDTAGNKMLYPASMSFDVDTRENFVVTIPETKGDYLRIGWDQFFLPSFVLGNTTLTPPYTIEKVLQSINGSYDILYHFDGDEWKSYVPGRAVNDLEVFNGGGFPYFIDMNVSGKRIEIN